MTGFAEFSNYDGLGLAGLVKKGDVQPIELVEEAISRIEEHNPKLNAVVYKLYEDARKAADSDLPDGAFKGVPMLIKDLMSTYKGTPTGSGCKYLKDFPMPFDSEMVKRFKASGAIIVAKTNTPEFGLQSYTEPVAYGATNNPWNLEHSPGGSSGGTAAAVAARFVPLGSGGDGGGSIRIPSSCNGLFGLKPTRGRTPMGPIITDAWEGFAIEHVLTRSVRDSAAMLDATAGADVGAPYYAPTPKRPFLEEVSTRPEKLRIAFTTEPFMGNHVHPDCEKGLQETVKLLQDLGHEVVEAAPKVDKEMLQQSFVRMLCGQVDADIQAIVKMVGKKPVFDDFEIETRGLALYGQTMSAGEYAHAVNNLKSVSRVVGAFFEDYDVLLTPTLADPPAKTGAGQVPPEQVAALRWIVRFRAGWLMKLVNFLDDIAETAFEYLPYTPLFNVTGQPAMSVPLHWNAEGLPIGMQFVGHYGDEATLLRLAGQLEEARPWFDKAPSGF